MSRPPSPRGTSADVLDQPGASSAPRLELDQADEPVEDPLLELAQDPEPPALDPLERVLPPGERDDLAELGVAFHAPLRVALAS